MRIKKKNWKKAVLILGAAALIDLFVPDPVPLIDEAMLIAGTLWAGLNYLM